MDDEREAKKPLSFLPKGWVWTRLGEICLKPQYGWTTSATMEGKLRLLRTTDITSGHIDWDSVPFCKKEPADKEKYLLGDGDIVISRAGSVGYSYLIKNPKEALFASYLIRFRPLVDDRYLAYFLKSPSYWNSISEKSLGIAIPNVNASKLKQVIIPLPPAPEQHRIVAKIEELFTRLDAGVETLKKAKTHLKRYRQAVLKHAIEGKLTEEWRRAHKVELEPASMLLERIKEEREKKAKGKYKELPPLDISDLLPLPEGWIWVKLEDLSLNPKQDIVDGPFGSNMKASEYKDRGIPIIRLQNIDRNKFIRKDIKFISFDKAQKLSRHSFSKGDIVITKLGNPLGKACIVPDDMGWGIIVADVVRIVVAKGFISEHFVSYLINSEIVSRQLEKETKGTTRPRVNLTHIRELLFPLPPLPEQHKIVEEIEHRLSVADEVEKVVEQSLKQAERLRQSILKKAFEGNLVPQDPSDEPAEKLLERIKAKGAKKKTEKKTKERRERKVYPKQMRLI